MIFPRTVAIAGALTAAIGAYSAASAQSPAPRQTLTVSSYGGSIDEAYRKAIVEFERKNNVTVRWVPGTATENSAKIIATRANPEYDVALLDSTTYDGPQRAGAFVKLDPAIVKNLADTRTEAKFNDSVVAFGFIFTGIFYNTKVFEERGWPAPTSLDDLFKPDYCNRVGILHPNVSYGSTLLILLAGGDLDKAATDGIGKLAKLKGCVRTLEPTSPKMEEKVQLGEYYLGVHGSIRVVMLTRDGYPIRFVIPKEGSVMTATTCSVVKGAKETLAQEFCNALLEPAAQAILRDEALYVPVSTKVDVPERLLKLGLPNTDAIAKAVPVDFPKFTERRRDWARRVEREMAP